MANESLTMSHPDAPVTRPGLHVTEEGRVVGARIEDFAVEWEGPEDERTAGVSEVEGIPVVHPNERTAFVSPETHEDLRKEAGLGGGGRDPGAAAPAVTTSVDEAGNKRTVEHEVNVSVSGGAADRLREALKEAEETMERLDTNER